MACTVAANRLKGTSVIFGSYFGNAFNGADIFTCRCHRDGLSLWMMALGRFQRLLFVEPNDPSPVNFG